MRTLVFMAMALSLVIHAQRDAARAVEPAIGGSPSGTIPALVYVSDYFSFVGMDDTGHVVFALDNNRGRDGKDYQAEHFAVLHDEREGWIKVTGDGAYENVGEELLTIPDSMGFRFEGTPRSGMTIFSATNKIVLRVEPITERLAHTLADAEFWMGSAPAVLEWQGRTLKGRVIYEYLYLPDFNRLTRTYWGLWKDFQAFYIALDDASDLYLHSQKSEKLSALTGDLIGFALIDGRPDPLEGLDLEVTRRRFTPGFYRWPVGWRLMWARGGSPVEIKFDLVDRIVLSNWVIGGFAMGIVKGEIFYEGANRPFYGLAELLM